MPTALLAAAGVGLGLFGAAKSISSASQQNKYQQEMINEQQAIEAQKKQQMELEAKRLQIETLRQAQRARAVATTVSTNQGGLFGSGLAGAFGQISGQEGTQLVSQSQNLGIGENIFGINAQLSQSKIGLAGAQTQGQIGASLSSLGGQLVSNASTFSKIYGSFGGSPSGSFGSSAYNPGVKGSLY